MYITGSPESPLRHETSPTWHVDSASRPVTSFKKTQRQSLARIAQSGRRRGERGGVEEREDGIPREGAEGAANSVTSISPFSPLKGDLYEGERDAGERDPGERDAGERDSGEREAGAATSISPQSPTRLPSPPRKIRELPTPGLHFFFWPDFSWRASEREERGREFCSCAGCLFFPGGFFVFRICAFFFVLPRP